MASQKPTTIASISRERPTGEADHILSPNHGGFNVLQNSLQSLERSELHQDVPPVHQRSVIER